MNSDYLHHWNCLLKKSQMFKKITISNDEDNLILFVGFVIAWQI
jgi:hypothetical protein